MKTVLTDEIWKTYCQNAKINDQDYDVVAFGDSPDTADELGNLIINGPKRATAGLHRDFESDLTTLPRIGGHVVVIDGRGQPLCIFQSTDVRVGPLSSIDDQFAWDEGEGDRTRSWWLAAHTEFFTRQATREGFTFTPDIQTVFERFKIVWPLNIADP